MRKVSEWMPPRYFEKPVYTWELTPRISEEARALLVADGFEVGGEAPRSEKTHQQFSQLDEDDRTAVVRYCEELDCLHEDLDFILFELDGSVRFFYQDKLDLKRLALIYHADNFYLRVHAYREKAFKLINHYLGLKIHDENQDSKFNEIVLAEVHRRGHKEVEELLRNLCREGLFREAFRRRNHFVHRLAERDWPMLAAGRRISDHAVSPSEVEEIDRVTNLDVLHMKKQEELGLICKRLARFRDDLVSALRSMEP